MNKYVKLAFFTVFAVIAGYNAYSSQKADGLSDLVMANIEALANDSESGSGYKYVYTPAPGDPNYGYTKCVCSGKGSLACC